jgi:hypothetical protein
VYVDTTSAFITGDPPVKYVLGVGNARKIFGSKNYDVTEELLSLFIIPE